MRAMHLRIHRANDVAWCGLTISWKRANPLTVETVSEEAHSLTSIKYVDGVIDRTPLTQEQKNTVKAEWARLETTVTCKGCRAKRGWK